ncbi:YrrS family protein [Alkalihalobacillus sp. AL-G]|uniref:YrrS family protein n=1 Tax=Alkalihalobacillus sp. AL-G TaxID=2926399 RepID=UPI00272A32D4|nr:YrrS family protein [Alkalihalobacillus sp. AL-G]WLD92182.1 YrrS family protein [Alkalihalobacillus sp. AL-G]
MKKDFSFQSRHERTKKKKQNLILNILIGAVFIGILAVGASMLLDGDEQAASTEPSNDNTTAMSDDDDQQSDGASEKDNTSNDNEKNSSEDGNKEDDKEKSEEDVSEDEDTTGEDSLTEGTYRSADDGGPEGPWEPVGTVQEGEHVSSFDDSSVDWKEKKEALQYATGLTADEIEYWWIGNGGSAQTAKGVVSTASNKENPYVVMLEWVAGEGWKPTSVERVPGAASDKTDDTDDE